MPALAISRSRWAVSVVVAVFIIVIVTQLGRVSLQVEKLLSNDPAAQLEATTCLRKLLSLEKKPPIQEVVSQPNVVQRLVQFLSAHESQKLQFEAAWALTNVRARNTRQSP